MPKKLKGITPIIAPDPIEEPIEPTPEPIEDPEILVESPYQVSQEILKEGGVYFILKTFSDGSTTRESYN